MARPILTLVGILVGSLLVPAPPAQGPVAGPSADSNRFVNLARTFQLDLPAGWRQLSPGESRRLAHVLPDGPPELLRSEPLLCYAVGPVDRWLGGEFDGVFLYVVEQDNEWHLDGDYPARLQEMWRARGRHDGLRHELSGIERTTIAGSGQTVITCIRTSTPETGRVRRSLDWYVPTGGRQLSLSFSAWQDDFATREEQFRRILATLTLARPSRGEQTLGDRLWTPLLAGAVVGLLLLLLYRHNRRSV